MGKPVDKYPLFGRGYIKKYVILLFKFFHIKKVVSRKNISMPNMMRA